MQVLSIVLPHLSSLVESQPTPLAVVLSVIRAVYHSSDHHFTPGPESSSLGPLHWLLGGVQTADQATALQHDE